MQMRLLYGILLFFQGLCFSYAAHSQTNDAQLRAKYPIPKLVKEVIGDSLVLTDLGPNINDIYTDMSPIVSPDGKTLYFWVNKFSTQSDKGYGSQLIHVSKLTDNGWSKAKVAEKPLNGHEFNAVFTIFNGGENMLIRADKGKKKGFSVLAKNADGTWGEPTSLNVKNHHKMALGTFHGASMSTDGQVLILYFSEKDGGIINNLYVSFKESGWDYSEPKLIATISDSRDDFAPFLAQDNKTLFFTSNRFGGLGLEDIYVTRRTDDSWMNWTTPVNAGYPINTNKYDGNFSIDRDGNAFLSSNRHKQAVIDIFGINPITPKPIEVKVDTLILIAGTIRHSKTKQAIGTAGLVYLEDMENGLVLEAETEADGSYAIPVDFGKHYKIWPAVENHLTDDEAFVDLRKVYQTEYTARQDLFVTPIEIGTKVRLDKIYFDYSKATLRPESFPELNKVIKFMNDYPTVSIELAGHTDSDGSDAFNQKLSQQRAESVMNYVVQQGGIVRSRIRAKGYGESRPVADNATEEGKQMNRRVEFEILSK